MKRQSKLTSLSNFDSIEKQIEILNAPVIVIHKDYYGVKGILASTSKQKGFFNVYLDIPLTVNKKFSRLQSFHKKYIKVLIIDDTQKHT